jgi:hypothetical protein
VAGVSVRALCEMRASRKIGHVHVYGFNTVDSRLSACGLTALRLNRGNVFLKKKFYFP